MILFVILGIIVFITVVVIGVLFYMLGQEGQKKEEEKAVPVKDFNELKKEFSKAMPEPQRPLVSEEEPEVLMPYEPKLSLPTQEVQVPLEAPTPAEEDAYKKRAQELEDELRTISQNAEKQSDVAREMIINLSKENQLLKAQQSELEDAKQKLTVMEGESSGLKTENINLQTQLETTNGKVRLLEEEMTSVKIQMGEEISRANAIISELTHDKEVLLSAPKPEVKSESDEVLRQELEALKAQEIHWKQTNAQLTENNELLEYELVKARAQSSGMERISFNYKNQVEDFLKKINSIQLAHDHLSELKNRLEGMVEEVKLQNEELVKKDHLAQFELEKNRSRLASLEHECEELKVRIQQQVQP